MTRMDGSMDASGLYLQCGVWGLRRWKDGSVELFVRQGNRWETVGAFPTSQLRQLGELIRSWEKRERDMLENEPKPDMREPHVTKPDMREGTVNDAPMRQRKGPTDVEVSQRKMIMALTVELMNARVDERQRIIEDAVARLTKHCEHTAPPYMFPDAVDEQFPGVRSTTIGEVLNEVWKSAFEQAIEVVREMGVE